MSAYYAYAQEVSSSTSTPSEQTIEIATPESTTSTISNARTEEESVQKRTGVYESARIISVSIQGSGDDRSQKLAQSYEAEIRSGEFKGKTITINGSVGSNPYQLQPKQGDKIVLFIQQTDEGDLSYYLEGFDRRIPLFWLIALFVISLAILSGWQGIKVSLSIAISIGLIGYVLIPSFLKGMNPVPIAIILSGAFTLISSGFAFGWNKKTISTTLGTIGGTLIALLISSLFASWSHLNGFSSEEDRMFFSQHATLDPKGLLFAGIIIASMGVIEDVAVSITSGIEQVFRANPNTSFKSLFTSGMIIGKNHTAAMANTIIFAYVGASLSTLLLFSQYDSNWLKFFNFDTVTEEIVRSLSATIGLFFTVPITALLATWFIHSRKSKESPEITKKTLIHTNSK